MSTSINTNRFLLSSSPWTVAREILVLCSRVVFICQSLLLTRVNSDCARSSSPPPSLSSIWTVDWSIPIEWLMDVGVEVSKYNIGIKARTHVNRFNRRKKLSLCVPQEKQNELRVAHCTRSSQFNFDVHLRRLPSIALMYASFPHLSLIVISGNISRWHVYTFVWLVLSLLP